MIKDENLEDNFIPIEHFSINFEYLRTNDLVEYILSDKEGEKPSLISYFDLLDMVSKLVKKYGTNID